MIKKHWIIVSFVYFSLAHALQTSSESVNPFNQFMSPSGGVNLYSGGAAFSFPLTGIKGVPVALSYSNNVASNARARNEIAPTSWVGLGWQLNFGSIRCDHKGTATTEDDDYVWISPQGVPTRMHPPRRLKFSYYTSSNYLANLPTQYPTPTYPLTSSGLYLKDSGYCDYFNIRLEPETQNFVYVFYANLTIPTSDNYTFYLCSDDGTKLTIDGNLVISLDYVHSATEWGSNQTPIALTAGRHTLKLEYFQAQGSFNLNVQYSTPTISQRQLPASFLSAAGSEIDGCKKFYAENNPYITFEPQIDQANGYYKGWIVKQPDGTKLYYGDLDFSGRQATRYTLRSGQYVGTVTSGSVSKYPYQWDLSQIQDPLGNADSLWYTQESWPVVFGSFTSVPYTRASYPLRISNSNGEKELFFATAKILPDNTYESRDPYGLSITNPNGFISFYESQRLTSIDYFAPGALAATVHYDLGYGFLNQGNDFIAKSLLTSIKEYRGGSSVANINQNTVFSYYDDTNYAGIFRPDYHFGALKSMANLQGAVTTYVDSLISEPGNPNYDTIVRGITPLPYLHGSKGIILHSGTYDNGKEFIVAQGGDNKDCIWLYAFDGHKWSHVESISGLRYGEIKTKEIYTNNNTILYKDSGSSTRTDIHLVFWENDKWHSESIIPWQDFDSYNYIDQVIMGNDFIVLRGGAFGCKNKIWLYKRYGDNWILDNNFCAYTPFAGDSLQISAGNNYFVIKAGGFGTTDKGPKIVRWDGIAWNETQIAMPSGKTAYSCIASGDYLAMIGGNTGSNTDVFDFLWIYNWTGNEWRVDPTYNGCQIYSNSTSFLDLTPGYGYLVVKHGGNVSEAPYVLSWDGTHWATQQLQSPASGDIYSCAYTGFDYFILTGGNAASDKLKNKLTLYRRTGGSNSNSWWTKAPELDGAEIRFNCMQFADSFDVIPSMNAFALMSKGIPDLGNNNKKLYARIYAFDGSNWMSSYENSFANSLGTVGVPTSFCATQSGFGFAWSAINCTPGSCNPADSIRLLFVHKYQDNYDNIRNYVVARKSVTPIEGANPVVTKFSYSNNWQDIADGIARFGKVSVILPDNGQTDQYFFNHSSYNGQDVDPNYKEYDGMSYRSDILSSSNALIAQTINSYSIFKRSFWPENVFSKRQVQTKSASFGVVSTNDILTYNDTNDQPVIIRTFNSDGTQKLIKTYFAFGNPAYSSAMGPAGANMLMQPCQTVVYQRAAGYNPIDPSPTASEVRSAQATTYSNSLGCNAMVPFQSYVWNSTYNTAGTPTATFADFNHSSGASNPNWQLTGTVERYDASGVAIQNKKPNTGSNVTFYRNDAHLPIGSIQNSDFYESGVFTCDYNMGQQIGASAYFDTANGWEKGSNASISTDQAQLHFGKGVLTVPSGQGAMRNFKIRAGVAYVLTTWVKPTGTQPFKVRIEYRKGPTDPLAHGWPITYSWLQDAQLVVNEIPVTPNGQWQLVRVETVPQTGDNNWIRVSIGKQGDGTTFSALVDDIRFGPKNSPISTTYYDPTWLQPIMAVDANCNPGKQVVYDAVGRPTIWNKFEKHTAGTAMMQQKTYSNSSGALPDANKWYKIVNKLDTTRCIDISNATWQVAQPIIFYTYNVSNDQRNQQWKFVDAGGGYYFIESQGGTQTYAIDNPAAPGFIYGGVSNDHTSLQINSTLSNSQRWKLINCGDGYFKIAAYVNENTIIDLDTRTQVTNGSLIQRGTDCDGDSQKWKIVECKGILSPKINSQWLSTDSMKIQWYWVGPSHVDIYCYDGSQYNLIAANVDNNGQADALTWKIQSNQVENIFGRIKVVKTGSLPAEYMESSMFTINLGSLFIPKYILNLLN